MESGIKLILDDLKRVLNQGTKINIITSDYMQITEPNALYLLLGELEKAEIKIFGDKRISFHPKTYIFEYAENKGEIIIGSSNLSKSALINGIEWNYRFTKEDHNEDFDLFLNEFNELSERNSFNLTIEWLRKYHENYKKTNFFDDNDYTLSDLDTKNFEKFYSVEEDKAIYNSISKNEPINFQIPALYELSKTRDEGYNKALVIAATGLGKTYLTAFDTLSYNKILFVAHREEILLQAENTYKKVHKNKETGFFMNNKKETDKDVIFATIQTLGKIEYLNNKYFAKDYFDYIIIDEFHHSASSSYQKLINYFSPKFLLGITATPDRMDNKDIYRICDYNIAYNCNFKTAINNSWLAPFKYYGIYDDINYSNISFRNGKYDLQELEEYLILDSRATKILEKYNDFNLNKSIAFCAGINHCNFMNNFFKRHRIKSESIHSKTSNRKEIIEKFEQGEIKVLFVVDIFNEGIDIPSVDSVLFLRPTESYTIFIQQLGRGLRLSPDKKYLTILDFVGNYKGAYLKPVYLTGKITPKNLTNYNMNDFELPENCNINFDFKLIDLFKEMTKNKISIKEQLKEEYFKIKESIQNRPKIMDIFQESNYPVNIYLQFFQNWLNFKIEIEESEEYEKKWTKNIVGNFLEEIEKTAMTKSYKIPVFLSFIDGQKINCSVKIDDIVKKFKSFYIENKIYLKDIQDKTNSDWQSWNDEKLEKFILKNPLHFLSSGQSKEFFNVDLEKRIFYLNEELKEHIEKENILIKEAFSDRVNYRLNNYFRRKYSEE